MRNYEFRKFMWDMFKEYIPYEDLPEMTPVEVSSYPREFLDACDEIARECEEEGYPSHGLNYSLRVESLKKEMNII